MLAAMVATAALPFVSPDGQLAATTVVTRDGNRGTQQIVVRDRPAGTSRTVYKLRESYARVPAGSPGPIVLLRWSGDSRWIFFAVDPMGSNSIAADGLVVQAVSVRGGPARRLALMLAYPDYFAWCNGRLVFTAGGNRLATTNKRLLVASPPSWRVRTLVNVPGRAWGSVACSPDRRSVVVQSQKESRDYSFTHTKWALWRVGLDGSTRRLTRPPRGHSDDSPRFARDGTLEFVRSHQGHGRVFELRAARLVGPLRTLGYRLGYYGHRSWWR